MKVKCYKCNKEFEVNNYKIKYQTKHFCSRRCYFKYRETLLGENNPSYKNNFITYFCVICGKKFKCRKKNRKCCSLKCRNIYYKNGHHPSWKGGKIIKNCEICNKEFYVNKAKVHYSKYCSRKCMGKGYEKYLIRENNPNWRGGKPHLFYPFEFNKQLKEQIKKRDNYRCQQCFRHQNELYTKNGKKYGLNIHHIDFNKNNNDLNNLISLCISCHNQTLFNRNNWTQYYQDKIKFGSNER